MLFKREIIYWHTTPEELREVADKLEKAMEKKTIGDKAPYHPVYMDGLDNRDTVELRVVNTGYTVTPSKRGG